MDFYRKLIHEDKDGYRIRPDWKVGPSNDLMTRGGGFYAIWDQTKHLWSTDINDVVRLVDADLLAFAASEKERTGFTYSVDLLANYSTKLWDEFNRYLHNAGNNWRQLDEQLVFANTEPRKSDYASKKLNYDLAPGSYEAWDHIVGTLYSETERRKIEWAIGSVVVGDSRWIQKFLVFYGPPGSGKSTIMNIIEMLFNGYTSVFDAKELTGSNNAFAASSFKSNPLVGIQHDGDLSRISDNTKLNSIVSHEKIPVNEKYQKVVEMRVNAFLFMGTNLPVKISDAKAGIIRRLIDVVPTQQKIEFELYNRLMAQVRMELGAIAEHCAEVYRQLGKNYYDDYRPTEMMLQTDVFYNFVESYMDVFKKEDMVSLSRAWELYKQFCEESGVEKRMPRHNMREELKNYFYEFEERAYIDGSTVRSVYRGFRGLGTPKPTSEFPIKLDGPYQIELATQPSLFDELYPSLRAQYAGPSGKPAKAWGEVTTSLRDLDTKELHWVQVPEAHIVIDFDLKDPEGSKSLELNLEAASKLPPTYAEVSAGGNGIHLHYLYTGDVTTLANEYSPGIEIKTLLGNQSLRRRLTQCNQVNITPLDGGLPKKEKPMIEQRTVQDERGLRRLLAKQLRKESHPGTKPSVDFMVKILQDAYDAGMSYDVTDMRPDITTFAMKSTNHAEYCMLQVSKMKFAGPTEEEGTDGNGDEPIVFLDCEVFPNLFIVCWKYQGSDTVVRMINPTPGEIEPLLKTRFIGFNNRQYDNHILYARYLGYSNQDLYDLTQRLFDPEQRRNAFFAPAYHLSYADIYDFISEKKGLKKWQIELGIFHSELDIPWDKPVPEEMWDTVADYCANDVISEEVVFDHRQEDFIARQILAELSGLTVNHTTQQHTAGIIFGKDKNPQASFAYTDLSKEFPGYDFDKGVSTYKGIVTGEGGYVYAEPGLYEDVAVLDITSMHPTTIRILNLFGPYTKKFADIVDARVAIKNKNFAQARQLLDGRLAPFLEDEDKADGLAYALKIVINIVYGLTSAKFENPFNHPKNKDNIVAKRGALFMIDLMEAVRQEMDCQVVHIKTDSIKIPHATPEIIEYVMEFGRKYGYNFEHEVTYEKFCLVNDAVYIATDGDMWTAVGAQFQHPFVFKTLFSKEPITFDDHCETRSVKKGLMYLDFSGTGEVDKMVHVGRTGSFVPVIDRDGGELWRVDDGKLYAVSGTKGYRWVTRDAALQMDKDAMLLVNREYFRVLVDKAIETIQRFNNHHDFEWFSSNERA